MNKANERIKELEQPLLEKDVDEKIAELRNKVVDMDMDEFNDFCKLFEIHQANERGKEIWMKCENCGIETRNTKKDFTKPIDYCRECIKSAEQKTNTGDKE